MSFLPPALRVLDLALFLQQDIRGSTNLNDELSFVNLDRHFNVSIAATPGYGSKVIMSLHCIAPAKLSNGFAVAYDGMSRWNT